MLHAARPNPNPDPNPNPNPNPKQEGARYTLLARLSPIPSWLVSRLVRGRVRVGLGLGLGLG